jgi:hypothetical protein
MGEDQDDDPYHLGIAGIGLFGRALDQHHDPETGAADADYRNQ